MSVSRATSRTCSRCPAPARPGQSYCALCHAAYIRDWRRGNGERLTDVARRRAIARSYAKVYQRRGRLIPEPCSVCGSTEKIEKHHPDHTKPLEVVWLCRPHHLDLHYGADRPARRRSA